MLSLTSEAAPGLSLAELDAGCRARGLDGIEIVIPPGDDVESVVAKVRDSGARAVALRIAHIADASAVARMSGVLGVPVSVPPAAIDRASLPRVVAAFTRERGRLLLGCPTNLDEALELVVALRAIGTPDAVGLAWEIHPAKEELAAASAILLAIRELLGVVRLHGGGPEQRDQDGRGIGPVCVELALTGFTGPIVLCPSSPEMVPRWTTWLSARGSSGCGYAVSARTIELDVRAVEPRHRLDTIMGAYQALVPGATLHLTVDHDPVCMYYTLEATEPERSFSFQVVENGPEVWRAQVTKR